MLSAMVQAQAAIVAIVITLTLIAVQLTASAYTPRVIDIFKKNPDMWVLLVIYGVSMLYGLVVLKMVVGGAGEIVSQDVFWVLGFVPMSFECCVSLAYWLEAFTLVALFPYMLNIISLLKPENIIKRLVIKITKDRILNSKEDPIQPIMDIIHGSVVKYDIATTRVGLKEVTNRMIEIIHPNDQKKILDLYCDHFERIDRLTVSEIGEEPIDEVIESSDNFEELNAENGLGDMVFQATESFGIVGITAAKNGLEVSVLRAAVSLGFIGTAAAGKKFEGVAKQAAQSLEFVGITAAENGLEVAPLRAAYYLGRVGKAAVKKELMDTSRRVTQSLGNVGISVAENELGDVVETVAGSLGYIGKDAAERELGYITDRSAHFLGSVGKAAAERELGGAVWEVVVALEDVGKVAAEKGLEDAWRAAESLGSVGKAAAEHELGDALWLAVSSLEDIGKVAAEKGLENVVIRTADSLISIGTTAIKKRFEDVASRAAESLAELTVSSEEIVTTMIRRLEQREYDLESLHKFMDLYGHELGELRTQKPD
jgi:hypothetical protein